MRCSDVEALWEDMREGSLPHGERAQAHLRHCRDCQHAYEAYEGVAYCLTCLPVVEPPANLVPQILEHIRILRGQFRSSRPDTYATMPSPLGSLLVAWRDRGITFVGIANDDDDDAARSLVESRLRRPVCAGDPPPWLAKLIADFFSTWHVDREHIDLSDLSPFERLALEKAAQIPPGEVRSYGWIAREIGKPQAARAVGQAMARNPLALFFPCHRVVDASGALHNYGYGVEVKARILAMEGYRPATKVPIQRTLLPNKRS